MLKAKRVLWGEGMFLRPHHFQQMALACDAGDTGVLRAVRRHAWGLGHLELDAGLLSGGTVCANALEVVFRDGTRYSAPEYDPPPISRTLADIPKLGTSVTVYACLPHLSAYGGNTAEKDVEMPRPARYRTSSEQMGDLYTDAIDSDVSILELDVRLMTEGENRDGFDSVPVARLSKDATGHWQQDETFLPPLLTAHASPWLSRALRLLLDILLAKSKALAGTHRERVKSVAGYGTADIASFWMLHTVNHNFALLSHLAKAAPLPPEELYLALAELCGELLTFSHGITLEALPEYNHEKLHETFPKLDSLIRDLLDTVISSRYVVIPLNATKPSFYVGHLDDGRLVENVDYYLSVQGDLPIARIVDEVPAHFKVGSPDDVEKILHAAAPGVTLTYTTQTPAGLPVQVGNHYFAFDPRGEVFEGMQKARSVCVYVPESLSSLRMELFAVFRRQEAVT
jgi:type VI secretion system protein ImpJ